MQNLTWAVLIPAYNAAASIGSVIQGCSRYLPLQNIIVVDDGSEDDTKVVAEESGAIVLRLDQNRGKGQALRTGFKHLTDFNPDWIICLDADGQHDPDLIPEFQHKAATGKYGLIIGNRMGDTSSMPRSRRFSNGISTLMLKWRTGIDLLDVQCGYRALRLADVLKMQLQSESYEIEVEMILAAWRNGIKIGWVPIPTMYQDESSYLKKLPETLRFLKMYLQSYYAK